MSALRPGTATRLKTAQAQASRGATGLRPGTRGVAGAGATLNTSVRVEDRPITQQGLFLNWIKFSIHIRTEWTKDCSTWFAKANRRQTILSWSSSRKDKWNQFRNRHTHSTSYWGGRGECQFCPIRTDGGKTGTWNKGITGKHMIRMTSSKPLVLVSIQY